MAILTDDQMAEEEAKRLEREEAARFMKQNPGLTAPSIEGPQVGPAKAPPTGDREKAVDQQVGGLAGKAFTGPKKKEEGDESSSGAWTNLEDYLKSNVAATEQMKQQFQEGFKSEAEQAKGAIGGLTSGFQEQVGSEKERVQFDPTADIESQVQSKFGEGVTTGQTADELKAWRDAQYGGPMGLQDVGDIAGAQKQAQDVERKLEESATEEGRLGLIREQELQKRPGLSYGETALNQALMGRAGLAGLDELRKQYAGGALTGELSTAEQQAAQEAQSIQAGVGERAAKTREEAVSRRGEQEQALQSELQKAQASQAAEEARIQEMIRTGQVSAADRARYGLQSAASLWGVDPSQYYSPAQQATLASVAEQEDVAKYRALADLAGTGDSLFGADPQDIGAFDSTGMFNRSGIAAPYKADLGEMGAEVNRREDAINKALSAAFQEAQYREQLLGQVPEEAQYRKKAFWGYGPGYDTEYKENPYYSRAVGMANEARARYNNLREQAQALYGAGLRGDETAGSYSVGPFGSGKTDFPELEYLSKRGYTLTPDQARAYAQGKVPSQFNYHKVDSTPGTGNTLENMIGSWEMVRPNMDAYRKLSGRMYSQGDTMASYRMNPGEFAKIYG